MNVTLECDTTHLRLPSFLSLWSWTLCCIWCRILLHMLILMKSFLNSARLFLRLFIAGGIHKNCYNPVPWNWWEKRPHSLIQRYKYARSGY